MVSIDSTTHGGTAAIGTAVPLRALTAANVAEALHVKKRIVLLWAKQGAPHRLERSYGKNSPRFNLDELRDWLKQAGLDAGRMKAAEAAVDQRNLFDEAYGAALASITGPADLAKMRALIQAKFASLTRMEVPPPTETGGFQRYVSSIAKLSAELRLLEAAEFEAQRRAGEWVKMIDAVAVASQLSQFVKDRMRQIKGDTPGALLQDIMQYLPSEHHETVLRIITARIDRVVGEAQESIAHECTRQASCGLQQESAA